MGHWPNDMTLKLRVFLFGVKLQTWSCYTSTWTSTQVRIWVSKISFFKSIPCITTGHFTISLVHKSQLLIFLYFLFRLRNIFNWKNIIRCVQLIIKIVNPQLKCVNQEHKHNLKRFAAWIQSQGKKDLNLFTIKIDFIVCMVFMAKKFLIRKIYKLNHSLREYDWAKYNAKIIYKVSNLNIANDILVMSHLIGRGKKPSTYTCL